MADEKQRKIEQELEEAKLAADKYLGAQQLLEQLVQNGTLKQMPDGSVQPMFEQPPQGEHHE